MYTIFIYDNSFEGFLTSIYNCFYSKIKPEEIISRTEHAPNLIFEEIYIETDLEKSNKVCDAIINKINVETLDNVYYLFLSTHKNNGILCYNYLKLGFKFGNKLNLMVTNDYVLEVQKICKKVTNETHIMLGLVRFESLGNNYYYSAIEPDHNILPLIAPHFSSRFADQNFIIHDLKREIAIFYNLEEWVISNLSKEKRLDTENKDIFALLWKDYFNSISIQNRLNKKLQNSHVRKRYKKHLLEFY